MEKGYRKLIVWQKADELAYKVFLATKAFPREEMYGSAAQLRRVAMSVPINIVEGMGRQGRPEMRRFMNIALGSLAETEYLLEFCNRFKYFDEKTYTYLSALHAEVGAILWRFYKNI